MNSIQTMFVRYLLRRCLADEISGRLRMIAKFLEGALISILG